VDPDKLVHRGGIIRERKKIWPFFSESNTSFYRRPQGDEGEHVARGKERYLGTAVAIRNAAAVVLVYPWNGKPRFDTIKTTFSQLDELTPVFVYHGGTTYLIEGEFGPQEIEVPAN
jgi:hypothetical protein